MASPDAEDVLLRIPALAPYAPIVRVVAAAMAVRLGMGFVEINNLRSAIDKAVNLLLDGADAAENTTGAPRGNPADADPCIDAVFRIVENRLEFEANRTDPTGVSETALRLFDDATRELVDELRVDPDTGAIRLSKALADVR